MNSQSENTTFNQSQHQECEYELKIKEEGSAKFCSFEGPISKQLPVFYNPLMKINRDITVLVLQKFPHVRKVALPLEASGIRGIRILQEVTHIEHVTLNDISPKACDMMKRNFSMNQVHENKYSISCNDANKFLLNSTWYDYIDIDPFGSPNPYLNNAISRLKREGLLGVTATDTAPLCATYPRAGLRKYWAIGLRNEQMHEIGLRILIRKVQLIGIQYDRALLPVVSYYKDHYFRIIFQSKQSKTLCDEILQQHQWFHYCRCNHFITSAENKQIHCEPMACAGPLWIGKLGNRQILAGIAEETKHPFVEKLRDECEYPPGLYDLHVVSKQLNKGVPSTESVLQLLHKNNIAAARTHIRPTAIRAACPADTLLKLLQQLNNT